MAWNGYFEFGGVEVVNTDRTEAYAEHAALGWFKPVYENGTLATLLGEEPEYTTPLQDDAPWTDPDDPDSYQFYGCYPLDVTGIEDSTMTAPVTESTGDGGVVGRVRRATRSMVMSLALVGGDECATEYGFRWLKAVMAGGPCIGRSEQACNVGNALCFLSCPPALDWAEKVPQYDYQRNVTIARRNLSPNPSMETDVSTWVQFGTQVAAPTRSLANPSVGLARLAAVGATNGTTPRVQQVINGMTAGDLVSMSCKVRSDPTNLNTNGSMDTGVTGWTVSGTGITLNPTASGRTNAGGLIAWGTGHASLNEVINQTVAGLIVGRAYTFSAWIRNNDAGGAAAAPGVRVSGIATGNAITSVGVWGLSTVTFQATATSHILNIANTGTTALGSSTVDDISTYVTTNLASNPTLDDNAGDWTVGGVTPPAWAWTAAGRTGGGGVISWGTGQGALAQVVSQTILGLTIGRSYNFSVWLRNNDAGAASCQPAVRISGIITGNTVTTVGTWTQSTCTFTATATSHIFNISQAATTAGGTTSVDDFLVQENLVVNPTFNTDLTTWTFAGGTAAFTASGRTGGGALYTWRASVAALSDSFSQTINGLTVGRSYTLSAWLFNANAAAAAAAPAVRITGVVTGSAVTAVGAWTLSTLTFTASATSHIINIVNTGTTNGSTTTFDDFSLVANLEQVTAGYMHVKASDGTTVLVNTNTGTWNPDADGWVKISGTTVIPPGMIGIQFCPGLLSNANYGGTLGVDEVLIENTDTVGTYFDGNTADTPDTIYDWIGTTNLSASTQSVVTFVPVLIPDTDTGPITDCLDPYLRSLHKVTATVGPLITGKRTTTDGGCVWLVTVTLVAGNPAEYSMERPLIKGFGDSKVPVPYVGGVVPDGGSFDADGFIQTEVACPAPVFSPIMDPLCPLVIPPPAVPLVALSCFDFPVNYVRRQFVIPAQDVPLWGKVVPWFAIHTPRKEVRSLRLRFYADVNGDGSAADDPCAFCGDIVFSYIPIGSTMVFDGADRQIYVEGANGLRRRADSLVFGSDGSPFEWPEMTCGHGYVVTLDLPQTQVSPVVDMSLYARAV